MKFWDKELSAGENFKSSASILTYFLSSFLWICFSISNETDDRSFVNLPEYRKYKTIVFQVEFKPFHLKIPILRKYSSKWLPCRMLPKIIQNFGTIFNLFKSTRSTGNDIPKASCFYSLWPERIHAQSGCIIRFVYLEKIIVRADYSTLSWFNVHKKNETIFSLYRLNRESIWGLLGSLLECVSVNSVYRPVWRIKCSVKSSLEIIIRIYDGL